MKMSQTNHLSQLICNLICNAINNYEKNSHMFNKIPRTHVIWQVARNRHPLYVGALNQVLTHHTMCTIYIYIFSRMIVCVFGSAEYRFASGRIQSLTHLNEELSLGVIPCMGSHLPSPPSDGPNYIRWIVQRYALLLCKEMTGMDATRCIHAIWQPQFNSLLMRMSSSPLWRLCSLSNTQYIYTTTVIRA